MRSPSPSQGLAYLRCAAFCFDVVILSMTLFAVHRVHMQHAYRARRWRFGDALCVQGIWYVAATCAVNVPVATLAFLNLNRVYLSNPTTLVALTQRPVQPG